MKVKLF